MLGDKPYELTEDIHIKPMTLDQREDWRKASYGSLTQNFSDALQLDKGELPQYVNYNEKIARALVGDQYDICRELFADDARGWDIFLDELREFNKVDGTKPETGQDAEGNDSAPDGSSQP